MNRGSLQCCTNPARACFRPGMSRSLGYLPRLARVSKNKRKNAIRRAERNTLRDSRQTTCRPWRHTRRSATSKRCGISSPLRDRAGKAKNRRRRRQGRARSATGVDLIHRRSRRSAIFRCVFSGPGSVASRCRYILQDESLFLDGGGMPFASYVAHVFEGGWVAGNDLYRQ